MRFPVLLLAVLSALGSLPATGADAPATPRDSGFVTRLFSVPTTDVPRPGALRTDGKELFAVPADPGGSFWIFDLASGERRRVVVQPPEGVRELRVLSVDRLGRNELVASGRWADGEAARNGLVFFDDEGVVSRVVPHGFAVGSIVVGPTKEWIVGSIQEEPDPVAEEQGRLPRGGHGLAVFDVDGTFRRPDHAALGNMVGSWEEASRTHSLRKVFLLRDTVVLTYPFRLKERYPPVAWIMPRGTVETEQLRKRSIERDYPSGWLSPFHWPRFEGELHREANPLGIVPIVSGGSSGLLVAWVVTGSGPRGEAEAKPSARGAPGLLLATHGIEGKDARRIEEITDGMRLGEMTSAPDGTAYAVTFRDLSKEWSISRIDF